MRISRWTWGERWVILWYYAVFSSSFVFWLGSGIFLTSSQLSSQRETARKPWQKPLCHEEAAWWLIKIRQMTAAHRSCTMYSRWLSQQTSLHCCNCLDGSTAWCVLVFEIRWQQLVVFIRVVSPWTTSHYLLMRCELRKLSLDWCSSLLGSLRRISHGYLTNLFSFLTFS